MSYMAEEIKLVICLVLLVTVGTINNIGMYIGDKFNSIFRRK